MTVLSIRHDRRHPKYPVQSDHPARYTVAGIRSLIDTDLAVYGRMSTDELAEAWDALPRAVLRSVLTSMERDGMIEDYRKKWRRVR